MDFGLHQAHMLGLGKTLIGGVCDSSLTFPPLSFLTYSKEGLVSFGSSLLNSLFTWFACFAILINSFGLVIEW